jgi:hypothetical protein
MHEQKDGQSNTLNKHMRKQTIISGQPLTDITAISHLPTTGCDNIATKINERMDTEILTHFAK